MHLGPLLWSSSTTCWAPQVLLRVEGPRIVLCLLHQLGPSPVLVCDTLGPSSSTKGLEKSRPEGPRIALSLLHQLGPSPVWSSSTTCWAPQGPKDPQHQLLSAEALSRTPTCEPSNKDPGLLRPRRVLPADQPRRRLAVSAGTDTHSSAHACAFCTHASNFPVHVMTHFYMHAETCASN